MLGFSYPGQMYPAGYPLILGGAPVVPYDPVVRPGEAHAVAMNASKTATTLMPSAVSTEVREIWNG